LIDQTSDEDAEEAGNEQVEWHSKQTPENSADGAKDCDEWDAAENGENCDVVAMMLWKCDTECQEGSARDHEGGKHVALIDHRRCTRPGLVTGRGRASSEKG
jgi:hypothetical protein